MIYLIPSEASDLLKRSRSRWPSPLYSSMLPPTTDAAFLAELRGAIGVLGALAVGRFAQSQLFGLSSYDPIVFAAAIGGLGIVVAVATWVPAFRASRVAPMEALRYE